jgi:hypothetical protein
MRFLAPAAADAAHYFATDFTAHFDFFSGQIGQVPVSALGEDVRPD